MVLTLYKLEPSPPARAVLMVIEYLKIKDVKFIDVDLLKQEQLSETYIKMNPQHTIPTLKDDDFVLWDSHAISLYLLAKYGDKTLFPNDVKKQATINQRLHFDSSILFPSARNLVGPVLREGAKEFSAESLESVQSAYNFTELFLNKPWIAGDDFSIADICAGATVSTMDALVPIDEKKHPKLKAWINKCTELDIFKKTNAPGVAALAGIVRSKMAENQ